MNKLISLLLAIIYCLPLQADPQACAPFTWITDVDGVEKAAMAVTAVIDGQQVELQFDTGSDVSGFYGGDLLNQQSGGFVSVPIAVGGLDLGQQKFYVFPQRRERVEGRLGLAALLNKIIKIDYPAQQICQVSGQQFETLMPKLQLTPARVRSNKLFLYAELNGDHWSGLFFDSGASLYDLLVDKQTWQGLTGRTGLEADNRFIQGWSHDQLVTTVGAPLKGKLSLAEFDLASPLVHYTRERPTHFSEYPVSARGLIGNAPFFNQVIVMDLRGRGAWFGVVKK